MSNKTEITTDDVLGMVAELKDAASPGFDRHGDARDGAVYVLTPEIVTAVKVAVVTGRPLLLSGPPGCGKSSLASYIARNLRLEYYDFTVTDEAEAHDILWRLDTVQRLHDAQLASVKTGEKLPVGDYIEPGPLWWSLDPESARRRGGAPDTFERPGFREAQPPRQNAIGTATHRGAVLLIDEIDKAESSFANSLLVPLGSRQFFVPVIGFLVDGRAQQFPGSPIVIITTNNERDLPEAFVRRCVALQIPSPTTEHLLATARAHFADAITPAVAQIEALAQRLTDPEHVERVGAQPSTGEFLDLVQTLLTLRIDVESEEWTIVEGLVIEKRDVRRSRIFEW